MLSKGKVFKPLVILIPTFQTEMTLAQITAALQAIVATIPDTYFLRATDPDANTDVDQVDLSTKTLVIFNNLPNVENVSSQSGFVRRTFPVELRIIRLADFDDNTVQGDTIRDACVVIGDTIFDRLPSQFDDSYLEPLLPYQLNMLGEVKIYDKTMTGVRLLFVLNIPRTLYYC